MKRCRVDPKSLVATEACNHEEQAAPGEADDVDGLNSSEELHTPVGEDDAETLDDALCKGSEGAQCENLADALGKDHGPSRAGEKTMRQTSAMRQSFVCRTLLRRDKHSAACESIRLRNLRTRVLSLDLVRQVIDHLAKRQWRGRGKIGAM